MAVAVHRKTLCLFPVFGGETEVLIDKVCVAVQGAKPQVIHHVIPGDLVLKLLYILKATSSTENVRHFTYTFSTSSSSVNEPIIEGIAKSLVPRKHDQENLDIKYSVIGDAIGEVVERGGSNINHF